MDLFGILVTHHELVLHWSAYCTGVLEEAEQEGCQKQSGSVMQISLQGLLGFVVANTRSKAHTTKGFYAALWLYEEMLMSKNRT